MKKLQLKYGYVTIVDDEDYEFLMQWKWRVANFNKPNAIKYADRSVWVNGKCVKVLLHRLLMQPPKGLVVDHIDGDGLNNQRANLRICTIAENSCNKRSNRASSSKYLGVCFVRKYGMWQSAIEKNGVSIHIGSFKSEMDAALAYDRRAIEIHGEFARLNFPCHNIRPIGGRIEHEKLAVGGEVINKNVEGV